MFSSELNKISSVIAEPIYIKGWLIFVSDLLRLRQHHNRRLHPGGVPTGRKSTEITSPTLW